MKQDHIITKDRNIFLKSLSEMLKSMQHLEEVCNVTRVREDNERIRAHKVVLWSVSIPSGTCSQYILWINPYKRSSGVHVTVKERYCEDFLKIKFFKVISPGRTNKIWCSYCYQGFFKAGPGCMSDHPDVVCVTPMRGKSLRN